MTFKDYWIEVFKTGTHTDSTGNVNTFTKEDLDKIIDTYNNQPKDDRHEAPVVIGHPEENHPAYGWVESLKRNGDVLMAKLHNLSDEFVAWVKRGLYKKRSIALYPNMTLRHIGFLGAVPPAIKGLTDPRFKSDDEFAAYEFLQLSREQILQKERSQKYGINIREGGRLNKPDAYQRLNDEQFADPVHYYLPLTPSYIRATLATWNRQVIRTRYTEKEQSQIVARIILAARDAGIKLTPYKWAYAASYKLFKVVGEAVASAIKAGVKKRAYELAEYINGLGVGQKVSIPTDLLTRPQLITIINEHIMEKSIRDLKNNSTNKTEETTMGMITTEQFAEFKLQLLAFITESYPEDIGAQIGAKIEELAAALVPVEGGGEPPAGAAGAAGAAGEGGVPPIVASDPPTGAIDADGKSIPPDTAAIAAAVSAGFAENPEVIKLQKKVLEMETRERLSKFNQFIEAQITAGVVVPKQKHLVMSALELGFNGGIVKFAEEDNKVVDKEGTVLIQELVSSFPKQVDFSEGVNKDKGGTSKGFADLRLPAGDGKMYSVSEDSESLELHTKVQKYIEEQKKNGKTITYLEALQEVKE